ncbi:hypothetical protein HanPSC8_Chr11g0493461 [Helianthus annuus]|nr:hypothetical protein HanPSC8_Chr11g0493461 [Helianthus annuus]
MKLEAVNTWMALPVEGVPTKDVLGTRMDTQDTSPSVLLFFDNQSCRSRGHATRDLLDNLVL